MENKVLNIETKVKALDENKVDAKTFQMIQNQLNRIEKNLDQHMNEHMIILNQK